MLQTAIFEPKGVHCNGNLSFCLCISAAFEEKKCLLFTVNRLLPRHGGAASVAIRPCAFPEPRPLSFSTTWTRRQSRGREEEGVGFEWQQPTVGIKGVWSRSEADANRELPAVTQKKTFGAGHSDFQLKRSGFSALGQFWEECVGLDADWDGFFVVEWC